MSAAAAYVVIHHLMSNNDAPPAPKPNAVSVECQEWRVLDDALIAINAIRKRNGLPPRSELPVELLDKYGVTT